jgi:hypothetical protein
MQSDFPCKSVDLFFVFERIDHGLFESFGQIRNNDVTTQLLELFADPDRVRSRFHRYSCRRHISEPLLDSLGAGSEVASFDHFSFFVESAVMAPDISKVNADRHLGPGLSVWNFCDEVMCWLFHGNSLSDPKDLAHPICRY